VFAHEYQHIGPFFSRRSTEVLEKERREASLATFLATTLLLPALLVAPVERDIRIINVINPFYAAAIPTFSPSFDPLPSTSSTFLHEGRRAIRMAVFTRHLQRVLDALPSGGQVPKTDNASTVPVVSEKSQKSNIVAISVCPGISRSDTIAPLLNADVSVSDSSRTGAIIYYLLQPMLRLLVKSPKSALQSVLHALFLPTPFKSRPAKPETSSNSPIENDALPEEILKPGALYRECAVVRLHVPSLPDPLNDLPVSYKGKVKEKERESEQGLPDDGELGGEVAGRLVWESFEKALKEWEKANPPTKKERSTTPPSVDTPTN